MTSSRPSKYRVIVPIPDPTSRIRWPVNGATCSRTQGLYGEREGTRLRVLEPESRLPSNILHRKIVHSAAKPSCQRIFLPSAYVRPLYEIGTSYTRAPARATCAVTSGSKPKRAERSGRLFN